MKSLAELSGTIVSSLQASALCRDIKLVEGRAFSETQFRIKFRAELLDGSVLQIYLYVNHEHVDYSYQVLQAQMPLIRWDNKEHFPLISSQPHYFHTRNGEVIQSPLNGSPENDLLLVIEYLRNPEIQSSDNKRKRRNI